MRVYTHGGWAASQHNLFDSGKLKVFLVLLTGFNPRPLDLHSNALTTEQPNPPPPPPPPHVDITSLSKSKKKAPKRKTEITLNSLKYTSYSSEHLIANQGLSGEFLIQPRIKGLQKNTVQLRNFKASTQNQCQTTKHNALAELCTTS